tara:strand:+ start:630 stop:881 length:252 start_codon:yes stop_codon:yes gene_type:complete
VVGVVRLSFLAEHWREYTAGQRVAFGAKTGYVLISGLRIIRSAPRNYKQAMDRNALISRQLALIGAKAPLNPTLDGRQGKTMV